MERSFRHRAIIRAVDQPGGASVQTLAQLTGASTITIRRDLTELETAGALVRIRGGALPAGHRGDPMPFSIRQAEDVALKQSLGARAARLIADHESIVVDNGTTCVAVARALTGRRITALCLNLHAAAALAEQPGARVVLPGGPISTDSLEFEPAQALATINEMFTDVVVLGACSASPVDGLTSTTHADAQLKRACIAASRRRILVTGPAKLTRTSTFRFADIEQLTHLVTTDDAPTDVLDEYRAAGVEVVLAPTPST